MDPKGGAVVDLMLDRAGEGKGGLDTILCGLRVGLSKAQRSRAADRLLGFLTNAGANHAQNGILNALAGVVDATHVERLEAFAGRDGVDAATRSRIERARAAARRRR